VSAGRCHWSVHVESTWQRRHAADMQKAICSTYNERRDAFISASSCRYLTVTAWPASMLESDEIGNIVQKRHQQRDE